MPAELLLVRPKYGHNLGAVVRAAATMGADAVLWTGDRTDDALVGRRGKPRLPREERLAAYEHVRREKADPATVFDQARERGLTPVAVEVMPTAELLPDFVHPDAALYVFGPEDGGLSSVHLRHCHRFVTIPSSGCVNLSAAAYLVLYDRLAKARVRA